MKQTNRKMRKILSLALAALFSCAAFGQAQIKTMKMKIADFPEKTTKVVLTGNSMTDARFRNIVKEVWTISPFEFCTLDEYESLKSNPDYYFLMLVKGQFSKESEPGIEFLSLVKGGVGASEGINGLFNVVDVPFRAAEDPDGREFILLPALLDIIQDHVLKSMDKDLEGYSGLSNYNINLAKSKGKRLVFAEQDLAADGLPSVRALYFKGGMEAMDVDDADDLFYDHSENTLVSFVVAPTDPQNGSYCYKLLIDAGTHTLYYFRKHRISKKYGAGFLTEDIKRISQAQ